MRILFVSMEFPQRPSDAPFEGEERFEGRGAWAQGGGGIGTYTALTARALAERGHEVHVLSCIPGQEASDLQIGPVHVHRRGHLHIRGLARLSRAPSATFRIEHAATTFHEVRRLGRFDVVEAPDYIAEGLGVALRRRAALVCQLHGPRRLLVRESADGSGWNAKAADALERFAAGRADLLTAPSQLVVRSLVAKGWLGDEDVRIIRNPVDVAAWRSAKSVLESPPRVVAIGRLDATKAPEVLVEAAAALRGDVPDIELVFAGSSGGTRDGLPYAKWLAKRAESLGVGVELHGRVTPDRLVELLGGVRALALMSRFDTFPLAALEALAAGRPVVCTTATGTAELLAGSAAGIVVAVDDPRAAADALRPFLLDATIAARAGDAGRRLVLAHCSPGAVAAEREACYTDAIARHSS